MTATHELEALLRPPVEMYSAAVSTGCAMVAAATPWALMMSPELGLVCAMAAGAFGIKRARQAATVLRYQAGLKFYKLTKVKPHLMPSKDGHLYLGEGFEWTQLHTQRREDAAAPEAQPFVYPTPSDVKWQNRSKWLDDWSTKNKDAKGVSQLAMAARWALERNEWWNPLRVFHDLGGTPILHGVGFNEDSIFLPQAVRNGHVLVIGTTRVGKTRLLEILVTQDIHAGDTVIVIDPKGDAELLMRMYAEAVRAGRGSDMIIFHLGYPDFSARYNGVADFARITEVATRAVNPLPGSGNSAAFKEFSWRFTNLVAQAQVALGRVPSYTSILRDVTGIDPLFVDYAELALDRAEAAGEIKHWRQQLEDKMQAAALKGKSAAPRSMADRDARLVALVSLVKELRIADPVAEGLATAVSYEKSFFDKIIASLGPLLEKLTTGNVGKLISPDYFDMNDSRPIFDWMQVIKQKRIVYVGLDALSDATVAGAVGNSMLADLASVSGKIYKTGIDPHRTDGKIILPTVRLHVDETNEVCGPEFVPMVNKGGGSGIHITAYTQALADFEAKVGDKAKAEQIIANFNHVIMFRVKSRETAAFFAEQLQEVRIKTKTAVTGVTDNAATLNASSFTSSNQDRIANERQAMITASDIMQQPRGQAFALLNGNRLYHLRFPLADASNDPILPESLRAVTDDMRKRYQPSNNWWQDTDWLATQPIGSGISPIDTELAA